MRCTLGTLDWVARRVPLNSVVCGLRVLIFMLLFSMDNLGIGTSAILESQWVISTGTIRHDYERAVVKCALRRTAVSAWLGKLLHTFTAYALDFCCNRLTFGLG